MSSIPIYGGPLCIYFREFHNRYGKTNHTRGITN
jgi:hypothetical protein